MQEQYDFDMMFTPIPNLCAMPSIVDLPCDQDAEFVALDTDGVTKINVCKVHSYNTRFWGVWPIEAEVTGEERTEEERRAAGEITDPVPVGSNKAEPGWTMRVESSIVRAEILVRTGRRDRAYLDAIVYEVGRLARRGAQRLFRADMDAINTLAEEGDLPHADEVDLIRAAYRRSKGVSLTKA